MDTNISPELSQKIATANAAGFITQMRGDTGATKEAAAKAYKRACDIYSDINKKVLEKRAAIRSTIQAHLKPAA